MNSGIVVLMKHVEKNDLPVLADALGIPPVFRWGIFTRLGPLTGPLTVVTIFFFFFLRSMYNKTVLRFGFCDIQNNEGLGKGYQPQLLPCVHRFRFWSLWLSQFQACPSFPPPPRAFVILSVPAVGICQKTSARGWDIVNSPRTRLTRLSSFNISLIRNTKIKDSFRYFHE